MRSGGQWAARPIIGVLILLWLAAFYGAQPNMGHHAGLPVRLGYFPNLTHAPALIGISRGDFQRELGATADLKATAFNAGPEAMEALLANAIDVSYVGPGPAINTYLKSHGKVLRVIGGACDGGAALVAREGSNIRSIRDLDGRRVAVPQLGGTQDISLRHFLAGQNLQTLDKGGSVEVLPIKSPDTLALMKRGEIDAAWMPEPWVTRLIHESNAKLVIDERDLWPARHFPTTVLVARTDFLKAHPEQIAAILRAHSAAVKFLSSDVNAAQTAVNAELKRLSGKPLKDADLKEAWGRVTFTTESDEAGLQAFAKMAVQAGYLPDGSDVSGLIQKRQ